MSIISALQICISRICNSHLNFCFQDFITCDLITYNGLVIVQFLGKKKIKSGLTLVCIVFAETTLTPSYLWLGNSALTENCFLYKSFSRTKLRIFSLLKGPFHYLGNFRVNWTAYTLLIEKSLTFQRQLWPEKKNDFFVQNLSGKGRPLSIFTNSCFFQYVVDQNKFRIANCNYVIILNLFCFLTFYF